MHQSSSHLLNLEAHRKNVEKDPHGVDLGYEHAAHAAHHENPMDHSWAGNLSKEVSQIHHLVSSSHFY